MVHWKLDKLSDELKSLLITELLDRCRKEGAEVRVSFYNRSYDQRDDNGGNDPTRKVNREVLHKLLTEAERVLREKGQSKR